MSTKIIAIIVGIAVIAGGAWYFTQNKTSDLTKGQTESQNKGEEMSTNSSSLKDLMALGKSQTCTFNTSSDGAQGNGTFYISGGKSRGVIEAKTENLMTKSNILYDGDTSYMWTEGSNSGFKFKVNEQEAKQAQEQAKGSIDPDQKFDVKCENWNPDNSLFNIPSNVTFQDFSALPTAPATADNQNNIDISPAEICGSLPEPAKSTCLANFKQ